MAYSTPFTAVAGNIILASGHNTSIRDNLEYLKGRAGTIAFEAGATFAAGITAAGSIIAQDNYVIAQSITATPADIGFRGQRSGSDADAVKYQWVNQAGTGGWEAIMPASVTTWQLSQVGVGLALELESGASGFAAFSRLVKSSKGSINSLSATSYQSAQLQAVGLTGVPGIGLTKTDVGSGVLIYHNGVATGADIVRLRASNNGDYVLFSSAYMGAGTGLDADTVDTLNPGNASGNIAVSNGTKCVNLNADLLDGLTTGHSVGNIPWNEAGVLNTGLRAEYGDKLLAGGLGHIIAGNATSNIPVSNGVKCVDLNADFLDGLTTGNGAGAIPINNGTLNTNLNAQMLGGLLASAFGLKYQTGTYVGDGAITTRQITTGFAPTFVIIVGGTSNATMELCLVYGSAIRVVNNATAANVATFTGSVALDGSDGFIVAGGIAHANASGVTYTYIAFTG